jgi:hypothetical protein
LEEIWDTKFEKGKVIGIALDDLKWATETQFNRHYNASHSLVIQNMRRKYNATTMQSIPNQFLDLQSPITSHEFTHLVPRYPNDGVLLFDTKVYNQLHILDEVNAIAMANGKGDNVVSVVSNGHYDNS